MSLCSDCRENVKKIFENFAGRNALIILYDRDLSSRTYVNTIIDEKIVENMFNSWLAIAIVFDSGICRMVVVSENNAKVFDYKGGFFYKDIDSIMRRNLDSVVNICR